MIRNVCLFEAYLWNINTGLLNSDGTSNLVIYIASSVSTYSLLIVLIQRRNTAAFFEQATY